MNPAAFKATSTDQTGIFSMRGIPPGDYRVLAFEDVDPGALQNEEFLAKAEHRAQFVTIGRGELKNVDLRVIPGAN